MNTMSDTMLPIFVYNLALPSVESKFHIFEPRYRLLFQHVMKQENPCFGMCLPSEKIPTSKHSTAANREGFCDVGVLCEVTSCATLPDGKMNIRVVGRKRFLVRDTRMVQAFETTTNEMASYSLAEVEWYEDFPDDQLAPSTSIDSLSAQFRSNLFTFHRTLLELYPNSLAVQVLYRIHRDDFELLSDPQERREMIMDVERPDEELIWFALDVLPIPDAVKYSVLIMQQPEARMVVMDKLVGAVRVALDNMFERSMVTAVPLPSYREQEVDVVD